MLVLDDLHWADSASLELVGALLRRPPAAPVLLALAMRPRHVPERLSAALERAWRAELLTRIELGALSADEARELLGDAVDGADADVALRGERRQPVLPRAARPVARPRRRGAGGARRDVAARRSACRRRVAAALAEELALLSDSERLVLEGAAVAGDPFEPELAAAAAGCPRRR